MSSGPCAACCPISWSSRAFVHASVKLAFAALSMTPLGSPDVSRSVDNRQHIRICVMFGGVGSQFTFTKIPGKMVSKTNVRGARPLLFDLSRESATLEQQYSSRRYLVIMPTSRQRGLARN